MLLLNTLPSIQIYTTIGVIIYREKLDSLDQTDRLDSFIIIWGLRCIALLKEG